MLKRLLDKAKHALTSQNGVGQAFVAGCDPDDLVNDCTTKKVFDALTSLVSDLEPPCENLMVHVDKVSQMHSIMARR